MAQSIPPTAVGGGTMTRRIFAQAAGGAALAAAGARESNAAEAKDSGVAFPEVPGLTRKVADFIVRTSYADVPDDVIALGKKSILDSLGLALCGSMSTAGKLTHQYVRSLGLAESSATIIRSTLKVPPRFAAFANGISIHGDDYDDTQLAMASDRQYGLLTHPSTTALPAALALAEAAGRSGRDLMLAYHLGVEVQCKIAEAMAPRHYEQGFHTTGTVGAFGAAAAAAKICGHDADKVARALGIAGSSAAGLRENFGTTTKPLHAGRAAESGVMAVDLVAIGWTATEEVLESPRGFYRAAAGTYNPAMIVATLGKPWTFAEPGISIKPFPSGSLGHPAMTELLRLSAAHKIRAEDVERVNVGTNRNIPNALIHHRPSTGLQAKFSMEFCLACLLLYGKAGLQEFRDEVASRPEVRAMVERVHLAVHPVAERAGNNRMTTILEVTLKGGRTVSGRADFAKGSPQDPMTFDEVAAKFRDCAQFAHWPAAQTEAIVSAVRDLERLSDVRDLTRLLAATP